MPNQIAGKWLIAFAAVLVTCTVASVSLSIISLTEARQARDLALPALAVSKLPSTVVHARQCVEPADTNGTFAQYDVEYEITVSNTGGRVANLIHAVLVSGSHRDIPWPMAMTNGPTNFGTAIDNNQATYLIAPVSFIAGQSKKMSINARVRANLGDASQKATSDQIGSGRKMQLVLVFSDNTKKTIDVSYTVANDSAAGQTSCQHSGDFHYHLDQL